MFQETLKVTDISKKNYCSSTQKYKLLQLLHVQPKLISGVLSHKDSQIKWNEIAKILNALPSGATKEGKLWKKTWQDLRCKLRAKIILAQNTCIESPEKSIGEVLQDLNIDLQMLSVVHPRLHAEITNTLDHSDYCQENNSFMEIKEENNQGINIEYANVSNSEEITEETTIQLENGQENIVFHVVNENNGSKSKKLTKRGNKRKLENVDLFNSDSESSDEDLLEEFDVKDIIFDEKGKISLDVQIKLLELSKKQLAIKEEFLKKKMELRTEFITAKLNFCKKMKIVNQQIDTTMKSTKEQKK